MRGNARLVEFAIRARSCCWALRQTCVSAHAFLKYNTCVVGMLVHMQCVATCFLTRQLPVAWCGVMWRRVAWRGRACLSVARVRMRALAYACLLVCVVLFFRFFSEVVHTLLCIAYPLPLDVVALTCVSFGTVFLPSSLLSSFSSFESLSFFSSPSSSYLPGCCQSQICLHKASLSCMC